MFNKFAFSCSIKPWDSTQVLLHKSFQLPTKFLFMSQKGKSLANFSSKMPSVHPYLKLCTWVSKVVSCFCTARKTAPKGNDASESVLHTLGKQGTSQKRKKWGVKLKRVSTGRNNKTSRPKYQQGKLMIMTRFGKWIWYLFYDLRMFNVETCGGVIQDVIV